MSKLEVMSEAELIDLIRRNLIEWAMEEARFNKDKFSVRYDEARETFLEALQEEL